MMTKMFQINIEQASSSASSNTHNVIQSNGQATKSQVLTIPNNDLSLISDDKHTNHLFHDSWAASD